MVLKNNPVQTTGVGFKQCDELVPRFYENTARGLGQFPGMGLGDQSAEILCHTDPSVGM
jgi:hypothetical protein